MIDFLARFPGRAFSLSDIVKGTGINLASCHAVLNVLLERGYVARRSDKSYGLGPALVAMGQVAMAGQPLLAATREAAQALSEELDLATLASTVIGDEIVGVLAIDRPDGRSVGLNVGERMPLVPPVGASFLAWSAPEEVEAWLDRAASDAEADQRAHWREGLASIRARGFQVELRAPGGEALAARMDAMAAGSGAVRYKSALLDLVRGMRHLVQPNAIEDAETYSVMLIAAPVFDREGACVYNLCLGGFREPLTGRDVRALGERLIRTCLEVMEADRR